MRFHVRKRRQTPAVIIVALVDVLIVLLIFLLVTSTFKQQPALKLALPEAGTATKSGANENAPLIISIDEKGIIRLGADPQPLSVDRLKAGLRSAIQKNPDLRVAISPDKNGPVGQLVTVLDAVREVSPKQVVLNVKEPAKR